MLARIGVGVLGLLGVGSYFFLPVRILSLVLGTYIAYRYVYAQRVLRKFNIPYTPMPSIKGGPSYQHPQKIEAAWNSPVAQRYKELTYQIREGYCGFATLNNLMRSLGGEAVPQRATPMTIRVMMMETEKILKSAGVPYLSVEGIDGSDGGRCREVIRQHANQPNCRLLANFQRGPLFYEEGAKRGYLDHWEHYLKMWAGGHWSPIGGYLEEDDLVFILDVNHKYGPFLAPLGRFLISLNTVDVQSQSFRGLILIKLQ